MCINGETALAFNNVEQCMNALTHCPNRDFYGKYCKKHALYLLGGPDDEPCPGCHRGLMMVDPHLIT